MKQFVVPLVIRGRVVVDDLVEHSTRRGDVCFATPDVVPHLAELPLPDPSGLADLHALRFEEILGFLSELGTRLELDDNPYVTEAFELSCTTSGLTEPVLRHAYALLPRLFREEVLREIVAPIGTDQLDGWVEQRLATGTRYSVRVMGPRMVGIMAGNTPLAGIGPLLRGTLVRSDIIFKAPSNDPATLASVVRTMCDMAPDHPVTLHTSVGYWKGGDRAVEQFLYDPMRVEKIYAMGGESSMRHVREYLRPGLELIAADPKISATVIGNGALRNESELRDVADRIAHDVGVFNQEACANPRVVYAETGTSPEGIATLRQLGQLVYGAITALPPEISAPVEHLDPVLRDALDGLSLAGDWFERIGAHRNEGGVIVSLVDEPVDFSDLLSGRIVNLVPVDSIERALQFFTSYTQTVGVYPPELKAKVRDAMALRGAERIVTLGHALDITFAPPVDGMEPLRRICKWIVDIDETVSLDEEEAEAMNPAARR